jgi:hypothetical protein
MKNKTMSRQKQEFYAGIITALAVVALHDEQTLCEEIIVRFTKSS